MTFEEVNGILGEEHYWGETFHRQPWEKARAIWVDDEDNLIQVIFDPAGRLIQKTFKPTGMPFQERLKSRITRRIQAIWP